MNEHTIAYKVAIIVLVYYIKAFVVVFRGDNEKEIKMIMLVPFLSVPFLVEAPTVTLNNFGCEKDRSNLAMFLVFENTIAKIPYLSLTTCRDRFYLNYLTNLGLNEVANHQTIQVHSYTDTSPLICGCGSYPSSVKSSYLKSKILFTSGLIIIRGNGRGSRVSCRFTCSTWLR